MLTLAGQSSTGNSNGKGVAASFYYPTGICIGSNRILYLTDYGASRIRSITTAGAACIESYLAGFRYSIYVLVFIVFRVCGSVGGI